MKLIMDHTCSHFGLKTLQRAFEIVCSRLGIADYDREVHLTFKEIPIKFLPGGMVECTGQMRPLDPPGSKKFNSFEIELAYGKSFYKTIASFAHELVHVKQYVTGDLSAKVLRRLFQPAEVVQTWMGCALEDHELPYDDRPWEVEAHGKMHGLAKHAILTMEKEGTIIRKSRAGTA